MIELAIVGGAIVLIAAAYGIYREIVAMSDILDITLDSLDDTGPLQMISGEVLARYQRIEAAARVAVHNRGGESGGTRAALDALLHALERAI